jgi:adenylate cyclase class 2
MEIEIKMPLADFSALRARLGELGAQLEVRLLETNIFLDRRDQSLRASDQGLRIRLEHDRDADKLRAIIITHKGPRLPGNVKQRDETELHVHNADDAIALLKALGYHETLRFEKRRDRWLLDHCHIELDTLPGLGSFVEIEGPDEVTIQHVREKMGLAELPLESSGYAAMVGRWIESQGIAPAALRF